MGDKIEQLDIQQGKEYEVEIDFTTREYNGRAYMSASAWKATPLQAAPAQPASTNDPYAAMGMQPKQPQAQPAPAEDSDLPF